jgi:hypothetical protein
MSQVRPCSRISQRERREERRVIQQRINPRPLLRKPQHLSGSSNSHKDG